MMLRRMLRFGPVMRLVATAVLIVVSVALVEPLRDVLIVAGNLPPAAGLMRIKAALGLQPSPSLPVTVIDIDEQAWRDWGRPTLTPRAKLAELVRALAPHGSSAILLDVDLSRGEDGDAALKEALAQVRRQSTSPEGARPEGTRPLPLLVPREIDTLDGVATARRTPFDDVAGLLWTSTRFATDDNGLVGWVRRWEPVCGPEPTALPSPLLYLSLTVRPAGERGEDGLNGQAWETRWKQHEAAAGAICSGRKRPDGLWSDALTRLTYLFGDVKGPVQFSPAVERGGARMPVLYRISARTVLGKAVSPDLVRDRVVVIGASHSDSGDLHSTPFGTMPGMMILANAIAAGSADVESRELGTAGTVAISAATSVAAGFLYQRLRFFLFLIMTSALCIAANAAVQAVYGAAAGAEVLAGALGILGALLGLESIWQTCMDLRRGRGIASVLKEGGA